MMKKGNLFLLLASVSAAQYSLDLHAADLSGYVAVQTRNFFEDPLSPDQENDYLSAVAE